MILAFLVLVATGTTGYRLLEGMETVDAVYMTIITVSTVGYGEVKPLSSIGRLFTIGLIVSGGGIAAYAFSSTATFLLSGEWRSHLEHKKKIRMLAKLSNHVIVCGYGRVGQNVAHELKAEGLPFVVIDPNLEKITCIQEDGYLALHGNASNEQQLKEAGIDRARGLVAAANSDAEKRLYCFDCPQHAQGFAHHSTR